MPRAVLEPVATPEPESEPEADPEFVGNVVALPKDTVATPVLEPLLDAEPVAAPDVVTHPDALVLAEGNGDCDALAEFDTLADPEADPLSAADLLTDADRHADFVAVTVSTGVDV